MTGVNDVEARLLYPKGKDGGLYALSDPGDVLGQLATFVGAAQRYLLAGNLLPGAGAEDGFNDLAFALPGGAKESYFELKHPLVVERLADLASLWGWNDVIGTVEWHASRCSSPLPCTA